MQQHGALAEQAIAILVLEMDAAELRAVHRRDAVVFRQPFIEERIVGRQQLLHVLVFKQDAPQEEVDFGREILAQLGVEFGEELLVPLEFVDLEEVEPAEREIRHQRLGLRSGQHTPHLGVQYAGTSQLALVRKLEQFIVGGPLPQEERQTRGQLQIVQRIEFRVFLVGTAIPR